MKYQIEFTSKLWLYPAETASWHFISLPKTYSAQIKKDFKEMSRGWGSFKVQAKIGKTAWETSIFPDSKSECYILPVKVDVRKKENLSAGMEVKVKVSLQI